MENYQHPTRTYRGKPACLGSIEEVYGDGGCSVCGRTWLSRTITKQGWTKKVTTHLHPRDMATPPKDELIEPRRNPWATKQPYQVITLTMPEEA